MWVEVYYRMVLKHSSTLGLDGMCVGHEFMLVAYVFLMLVVYVLVSFGLMIYMSLMHVHAPHGGLAGGRIQAIPQRTT